MILWSKMWFQVFKVHAYLQQLEPETNCSLYNTIIVDAERNVVNKLAENVWAF